MGKLGVVGEFRSARVTQPSGRGGERKEKQGCVRAEVKGKQGRKRRRESERGKLSISPAFCPPTHFVSIFGDFSLMLENLEISLGLFI